MRKLLIALCLVAGMAWGGMEFDGTDSYVHVNDSDKLSFASRLDLPFTVCIWAKTATWNTGSGGTGLVGKRTKTFTLPEYGIDVILDKLYFSTLDGANNVYRGCYAVLPAYDGKLVSIVCSYLGGQGQMNNYRIYINGARADSGENGLGTYVRMDNTTSPVTIGELASTDPAFDGEIYTVGIYPYGFSASDASEYYNSLGKSAIRDSNMVFDASTNAIHGINMGATLGVVSNDYYMHFTQVNTPIYPPLTNTLPQNFTYSAVVSFDNLTGAVGNNQGVICSCDDTSQQGVVLALSESAAKLYFYIYHGSGWSFVGSDSAINSNQIYTMTCTYGQTDDTLRMYIDGVLQSQTATAASVAYTATSFLKIGQYNGAGSGLYDLQGKIFDVKTFDRVLTSNEVFNLHSGTYSNASLDYSFTPATTPPIVPLVVEYYGATGYGDGQTLTNGTVITDYSGSGLHGYATNGVKQVSVQVSTNAAGFTTPIPVQRIKRRK